MAATKNNRRKKTSKTRFILVAGILTALVAALLFTFGLFYLSSLFGSGSDNNLTVPELVGLTLDEARDELEQLELQYRVEFRFDSEAEANRVISQNPAAGMTVRPSFPVELIVSTIEDAVEVPDVVYKSLDDARFTLEDEGFVVGEESYVFSDLPKDTIIRQDPRAGSPLQEGGTVNLIISEGPEVEMVIMPNVVGVALESARTTLDGLNLTIGEVREDFSNEYVENIIISQSVPSGREVAENTSIILTVSKGVEEVQIEEPVIEPQPEDPVDPTPTEPQEPGTISTRTLNIGPVGASGTVEVRMYRLDAGQRTLIFSKNHNIDEEGDRLQVTVTGSGTQRYEIDINGTVVQTAEVIF
jgi:serine/threonine-protein kinase